MESLYAAGWRQGSIFTADLPLVGVQLDSNGIVTSDTRIHNRWIIATQDCDLDRINALYTDDVVELRPILDDDPPTARGIRSQKLLLLERQYLDAQSRRTMISPAALTALLTLGTERDDGIATDVERKTEFKTWLGYRYDRPAVPSEFVDLAKHIAKEVERRGKTYSAIVRDILVQFESAQPPIFYLFAVTVDDHDTQEVIEWLTAAALKVPTELGILGDVQAATAENTSLALLETSFAADTSQITWSGKGLRGQPGKLSRPVYTS